jgi:hypothetical protein
VPPFCVPVVLRQESEARVTENVETSSASSLFVGNRNSSVCVNTHASLSARIHTTMVKFTFLIILVAICGLAVAVSGMSSRFCQFFCGPHFHGKRTNNTHITSHNNVDQFFGGSVLLKNFYYFFRIRRGRTPCIHGGSAGKAPPQTFIHATRSLWCFLIPLLS